MQVLVVQNYTAIQKNYRLCHANNYKEVAFSTAVRCWYPSLQIKRFFFWFW